MEKFLQILNKEVNDETAAFAILGAMVLTFSITLLVFDIIRWIKTRLIRDLKMEGRTC